MRLRGDAMGVAGIISDVSRLNYATRDFTVY
jgi:hypothetical protein